MISIFSLMAVLSPHFFKKRFFLVYLFILRGRESTGRGGMEREERERIPSRLCTVSTEPKMGLELTNLTNREIMT